MRSRIAIIFSFFSFVFTQDLENLSLLNTIKDITVSRFDVVGDRLYAVHPGTNSWSDGAALLSIANLTTAKVIAEGGDGTAGGIKSYPEGIHVFGDVAILTYDNGLHFFDISGDAITYLGVGWNASKNSIIFKNGNTSVLDQPTVRHSTKLDNKLYAVMQWFGFAVYDMTNPESPVTLKEFDYESASDDPVGIHVTKDYIFIADIGDKKIRINKNGGDYSVVGTIDNVVSFENNPVKRIATHGNYLYTSGKTVYDITDPANAVKLTDHNFPGAGSEGEMKVVGDYLLMTEGHWQRTDTPRDRAWVYNIKDYKDVKLVSTYSDTMPSYDIDFVNNKLYVSFGGNRDKGRLKGSVRVYGDDTPPTITSVSLANDNSTIAVTMSEAVFNTNSGSGALEASDFSFSLSGGVATLSSATPTSISINGNVYTLGIGLTGTPSGDETLTVNPVDDSIYDGTGKEASTDQSNNSVKLKTIATISSTTIVDDNSTITVTISDPVYNTNGASGNLEVSDFVLSINGGVATLGSATPTSIERIGYGDAKSLVDHSSGMTSRTGWTNAWQTFTMGDEGALATVKLQLKNSHTASYKLYLDVYSSDGNSGSANPWNKFSGTPVVTSDLTTVSASMGQSEVTFNFSTNVTLSANTKYYFWLKEDSSNPAGTGGQSIYKKSSNASTNDGGAGNGWGRIYHKISVRETSREVYKLGLNISGAPNGSELLTVNPQSLSIYNASGVDLSTSQSNNTVYLNDKLAPTITSVSLANDNSTIAVTMSEAVFNTNSGSGALEASDFSFSLSGGVATLSSATPTSISINGNVYTLGIGLTGTPSGDETLTVNPVDNGIYDSVGNEATTDQSNNTAKLNDLVFPVISSVTLASNNSTIAVTMSEAVFNTNSGSGALEASDFSFSLSGGVATLSSATPTSISINGNVYTLGIGLSGTPSGDETLTVNPVDNGIYDSVGNEATTDQSNNTATLNDKLPPVISSTTIANDNSSIAVTFSELVYNTTGGSGALEVTDFTLSSTGGVASVAAAPSSISIKSKVITLGLNITGVPDGSEKLLVVPSSATAIYDAVDNAASTTQSNNTVLMIDKAPPTVTSVSSSKDNATYGIGNGIDINVTFSEAVNVTGNPKLTLETGVNDATINYNDGTGTTKLSFNYVVSEGDTTSDLDYVSDSGLVVVDGSIKDEAGNSATLILPNPGATNSLGANKDIVIDGIRPIIDKVTMAKRNETLNVKMSEPVYNTSGGSGELEIGDFKYSLKEGTASLVSFSPFSISKEDSTYTLDLKIQGYASGNEKLTVHPVDDSVYDFAGNEMDTTQANNTVNLFETTPPMITSVILAKDNSSIAVTLSELSYSTDSGSGFLEVTDFLFTISGGVAQLVSNNPITISDSVNTYTLGLSLSTLADGSEKLTVSPADSSIYDALGNQSLTSQSNNEVNLYDFVVPVITQVSGVEANTITPTENVEIEIMVSEPIASVSINMSSVLGDSIVKSYTIQKDRINLTLSAPFTSGDSIRFDVKSLTDLSSNVGEEKQYQYYVSILGDYNKDGSIDLLDLNNFTSAWEQKALSYEIGPVSGTAPHFKPLLDGVFNSRDGMAFYRMWHWDYGRIGKLEAKLGPNIGQNLNSRVNRDKFAIKPPEGTHGSEIIINYLPSEIRIHPSKQNNQNEMLMSLSKQDTLSGYLLTHQIHSFNKQILFDLFDLRVDKTLIAISYRYIDQDNQVIGSGYEEVLLSPVPEEFALHQNYPNPFNPITTIQYDIPIEGHVKLVIYDILGREVVQLIDKSIPAGYHTTVWDSKDNSGISMPGGVYFYQLQTRDYVKTFKMVLLK